MCTTIKIIFLLYLFFFHPKYIQLKDNFIEYLYNTIVFFIIKNFSFFFLALHIYPFENISEDDCSLSTIKSTSDNVGISN